MNNQPDHSSRGHAEFSPSSLKYVAACSGYTGRSGTNAAAEKGTRIHEALEIRDPSALHNEEEVMLYEKTVEQEDNFLDEVIGDVERIDHNEIQVDVQLNGTQTWGTCDRITLYDDDKAVMGDYKTGISIIDEPTENWQAKAYSTGAFQKFQKLNEIIFVFYIPARNEVLSGTFTREGLSKVVKDLSYVIKSGELIRPQWEDDVPDIDRLNPNINCRFCKHEEKCPALGNVALEIAHRVSESAIPKTDIIDPKDPQTLEQLWSIAKIVTNWASRIKSVAVDEAKKGMEFPTLKLKSMGASRKCIDNQKLVELAKEFNLDEEDVIRFANFPLKKISDEVGRLAPDGEKGQRSRDFMDALTEASIIDVSETRYTLK
tara:strand:- start:2219 stop:3340 length:1122 start_codon:yes stop_codon:yes gene_type:complete